MYRIYKAKHYNGKVKVNNFSKMTLVIVLLVLFALNSISGILSYLTASVSLTNEFTIADIYWVEFDSNGGTGTMNNQLMIIGSSANLATNTYTKSGSIFDGWNTEPDGSGTSYSDEQSVTNLTNTVGETVTLYAQWVAQVKYAVQIYGINQDVAADGTTPLGLTFGPATGDDYNNKYVTHEYEAIPNDPNGNYYVKIITHTVAANGTETATSAYLTDSSSNNVTRTPEQVTARQNINLHTMTWAEIAAVSDKTVFEDCMLCGDTKSVSLTLNSTITSGSVYNQYGDGAGTLVSTINAYYRRWNPSQSQNSYVGTGVTLDSNETSYGSNARNAGGYSVSHIRATLIGENTKTNQGYAGDVNLSSDTCLYSCIEDDLQAVITPKKIKYVTGTGASSYTLNDDISDSIWLFSDREMYGTGQYSGNTTEGFGSSGEGYARFSNTESKYYISSYNVSSNTNRVVYNEAGFASVWWLRSPYLSNAYYSRYVINYGYITYDYAYNNNGLVFGFCIGTSVTETYEVEFDANGGTGSMTNQEMTIGASEAIEENSYTKVGYTFAGWNTQPDGSGESYSDEQAVINLTNIANSTVILYAQWTPNKYYIEFDENGGSGSMSNQEITYDTPTNLTQNSYTRTGYVFRGWNTEPDGSGTSYTDKELVNNLTNVANDTITLYAKWQEITGVAEINGTFYRTLQAAVDAVLTHTSTPVEIILWDNVSEDITIQSNKKIIFDLQNYTVSNKTSGTKATIENNGTLLIKNGLITKESTNQAAVINNNPGATLRITGGQIIAHGTNKSQGIYNKKGTVEISGDAYISSESTNRGTITNIDGGTLTITGGTIIAEGYDAINCLPAGSTPRGGTVVIGVNDGVLDNSSITIQGKINGINVDYANVEIYDGIIKGKTNAIVNRNYNYISQKEDGCRILEGTENIGGDTYQTVQLTPSNTVTFNPTGGQVSPAQKYVDTGDEVGELPVPTQTGFVFMGWFTEAEDGTQITEHTTVNGNITYYAQWKALHDITFNANGGSVQETHRYLDTGEEIGELPIPTRSEYRFLGWFTEAENGTQITEHTIINSDDTYYAQWAEVKRVIFDANGGRVQETERYVDVGEEIGELPVPTKTSSTFLGWFTERQNGTQITEHTIINNNVKYYAHWTGIEVARINGVGYAKLQDAINDVPIDNTQTTIELLCDLTENVTVAENQNIVFDLKNYTLSHDDTVIKSPVIKNNGTVLISNGTITSSAQGATIDNLSTGTLTITGGNIISTGTRQCVYNNGGHLTITGDAYLSSTATGVVENVNLTRATVQSVGNGIANITGGTIIGINQEALSNAGTMTIGNNSDGNISTTSPLMISKKYGIVNTGTFNFYDGIFKVSNCTKVIDGALTAAPDGYDMTYGTETIDSVTYTTAYLSNVIGIPTANTGLEYNRRQQVGVNSLDTAYTITGNKAVNAGTYTATLSLKYPSTSTWSDGTTTDKQVTYTISTVTVTPVLEADDKVYDGTTTATGTITLQGVVSGDNSNVTATATSIEFATPDIGTDIAVTATGITLSGSKASNYVLSLTTAESTANITSE